MSTARAVYRTVGFGEIESAYESYKSELSGLSGQINIIGTTSYTSQEPWIFSGTFLDNILLGRPLDHRRLQEVISVCCLVDDIAAFADGENTLIGERGVTLSGGQKTRVALARAVYQKLTYICWTIL